MPWSSVDFSLESKSFRRKAMVMKYSNGMPTKTEAKIANLKLNYFLVTYVNIFLINMCLSLSKNEDTPMPFFPF